MVRIASWLRFSAFVPSVFLLIGLVLMVPGPVTAQEVPDYLPGELQPRFENFASQPEDKAFALGPRGSWGFAYGHDTLEAARSAALTNCEEFADSCVVIVENDRLVRSEDPFPGSGTHSPSENESSPGMSFGLFDDVSRTTAGYLGLLAVLVLGFGTLIAERYPVMYYLILFPAPWLPERIREAYINYAVYPPLFVYFVLMGPVFEVALEDGLTDVMSWISFVGPIVLAALAPLYLQYRGVLGIVDPPESFGEG